MSAENPRVRRTPGPWWLGVFLVVPALLGFVGAQVERGDVEKDLQTRTAQQLQAEGLSAQVIFYGRDATVRPASGSNTEQVKAAVEKVTGVGEITVEGRD